MAAAATLGFVVFACGTDNQSSVNQSNIPTSRVCPKIHPLAISNELLAPKGLATMTIALTFDSGPSPETDELEQFLAQKHIAATFFITGQNVAGNESVLKQTATDGHLLANRGNTDDDLTNAAAADLVKSVTDTDTLIAAATTIPTGKFFFRPPYGGWSAADGTALQASAMSKYTGPVAWDIGDDLDANTSSDSDCFAPDTGTPKTPQECGDLYLAQIRSKKSGVVLMHDGPPDTATPGQTSQMIQYMIPILQTEGYKFARMDELTLVPQSVLAGGGDTGGGDTTTDGDGGTVVPEPADDPCAATK